MEILRTIDDMRSWRARLSQDIRVGFAPTMGNLHAGHVSLIHTAKSHTDITVASIFVNPMQFGPGEDLESYPRTLEVDLAKLQEAGATAVFIPRAEDIYPEGIDQHTSVDVPNLTDVLCGAQRPDHFRGVTTVVSKLLGVVRPHIAFFGAKDLQQVLVIKKMVRDLLINVEIVTVPTLRDPDGLAMSSRNGYLTPEERALAPNFAAALTACALTLQNTPSDASETIDMAKKALEDNGFVIDYLETRRTSDLSLSPEPNDEIAIFGAVYLGTTRLIDNRVIPISRPDLSLPSERLN